MYSIDSIQDILRSTKEFKMVYYKAQQKYCSAPHPYSSVTGWYPLLKHRYRFCAVQMEAFVYKERVTRINICNVYNMEIRFLIYVHVKC